MSMKNNCKHAVRHKIPVATSKGINPHVNPHVTLKNVLILNCMLFLFATATFAQQKEKPAQPEKPRLVVFVVGLENPQTSDYFTNLIGAGLSQSYTIIPRTETIIKKMQELKAYEDGGQVDDRQLIEWGKQHNVQTLCLITVASIDEYMFSAQLTDVKTNTQKGNAEYEIPSLTSADLKKAASALTTILQQKKK